MGDKDIFHEWESRHSLPKVTVQVPTARSMQSAREMADQIEDDFMSGMFKFMGDNVTITTSGSSSMHSINLNLEDARDLAHWLLEHTK